MYRGHGVRQVLGREAAAPGRRFAAQTERELGLQQAEGEGVAEDNRRAVEQAAAQDTAAERPVDAERFLGFGAGRADLVAGGDIVAPGDEGRLDPVALRDARRPAVVRQRRDGAPVAPGGEQEPGRFLGGLGVTTVPPR